MWKKKILMCRPKFYKVDYEINRWMNIENKVDENKALEQWTKLHHLVIRCGGYVKYIEQQPGLPDMVFAANAGIIKDRKFFVSTFLNEERAGEESHWTDWFLDNGYDVSKLPKKTNLKFEGAGDCLEWGDHLICGYGFRSSENGGFEAGKKMGYNESKIKRARLVMDNFYHLDTCFCPLNSHMALAYLKAFQYSPFTGLGTILPVTDEDAMKFACNSVVIGEHVIMPAGCDATANMLADNGFKVHLTDMSEFIKAGGACKCLTLELSSSASASPS